MAADHLSRGAARPGQINRARPWFETSPPRKWGPDARDRTGSFRAAPAPKSCRQQAGRTQQAQRSWLRDPRNCERGQQLAATDSRRDFRTGDGEGTGKIRSGYFRIAICFRPSVGRCPKTDSAGDCRALPFTVQPRPVVAATAASGNPQHGHNFAGLTAMDPVVGGRQGGPVAGVQRAKPGMREPGDRA